jgi:DNA-binding MarR family transcriptional regulator
MALVDEVTLVTAALSLHKKYRDTINTTVGSRHDIIRDMVKHLTRQDYQSLAELRHQIRRFLRFSEQAARNVPLEPRQHQLMLAIKGLPEGVRPRIGELAERLQIEHHSAVELANRLSAGGYVRRRPGGQDRREVLLALTPKGERVLRDLSLHHKNELRTQGPALVAALKRAVQAGKNSEAAAAKTARGKTKRAGLRHGRT